MYNWSNNLNAKCKIILYYFEWTKIIVEFVSNPMNNLTIFSIEIKENSNFNDISEYVILLLN